MSRPIHPKVVAGTGAAAAASVLVQFILKLPAPVADSIVVLAAFAGGWLRRA